MKYIAIAIFFGILITGFAAYLIISSKLRSISSELLGTENLLEGLRAAGMDEDDTPKSVNAMTSLYLPKIKKDFPEFNYDEMKTRAQNVITSYLRALSNSDTGILSEGNAELREKLSEQINMLRESGQSESYSDILLNRTEISDYRKENARCIITFQSSLKYRYSKTIAGGSVADGSPDRYTQTRYETDLIYIQDRDKITNDHDYSLGSNCPNCGAPLKGLGEKICEYCGTPLREVNIYAWSFCDVRKR